VCGKYVFGYGGDLPKNGFKAEVKTRLFCVVWFISFSYEYRISEIDAEIKVTI